jgi:error-prone DNA polymerase
MSALFRDIPEAIANTRIVSNRLEFTLNNLGYEFPHYPVPDGETMDSFLEKRVDEGVRKRYGSPAKRHLCLKRLAPRCSTNCKLIAKLGFAGYFLIVWEIIRYCQRHGFLVQGAARRPTPPSVTRSKSRQSIQSAWSCSSSDS